MINLFQHRKIITTAACCLFFHPLFSQVKLPRLVRDSMVLQRDAGIHIWGWAAKDEKINIRFNDKRFRTVAGKDGKWSVVLPPMKAGGPYRMDIIASNHLSLKDILVGDVWICSGQSNMVLPMERVKEKYPDEIARANYPQIRHFFIPTATELQKPQHDLATGYWKSAIPQDVLQFSATAYFFARALYEKYNVPVGLINSSVGGTPIEAWISEDGLKTFPELIGRIEKNKDTAFVNSVNRKAVAAKTSSVQKGQIDKGLTGSIPWYEPAYIPQGWHAINIPGYWEDQGVKDLDGVVWYRKEIDVPASMTNKPAKIFMGRIVDADYLYVNGRLAGNITYQYPPRRYEIPTGMLKPGKNLFVIRVINHAGKGGFVPDKPYYLQAGDQTIDLKGGWQYKVGEVFIPGAPAPTGIVAQDEPAALFNAMIAPLTTYPIKGFLWYQGEANTGNPSSYYQLLPALIADWRKQWRQADLPFLYVQLANYMDVNYLPSESKWAILREAQLKTLSVPHTGMAVAIDLGEWNDIHPLNKKDVGQRLALAARRIAYGETNTIYSGPIYESSRTDERKIIISFKNTGSGLMFQDGGELNGFAIAGADKKFVWAQALIVNNTVVVWSDRIADPLYVRYAWADNPLNPNLYNREGLPASPFRTDTLNFPAGHSREK